MTGEPAYGTHDYRAQQLHREHVRDSETAARIMRGSRPGPLDRLTDAEFDAVLDADMARAQALADSGYGDAAFEECVICGNRPYGGQWGQPCVNSFGDKLPRPHNARTPKAARQVVEYQEAA